jgi:hypothetical protein
MSTAEELSNKGMAQAFSLTKEHKMLLNLDMKNAILLAGDHIPRTKVMTFGDIDAGKDDTHPAYRSVLNAALIVVRLEDDSINTNLLAICAHLLIYIPRTVPKTLGELEAGADPTNPAFMALAEAVMAVNNHLNPPYEQLSPILP